MGNIYTAINEIMQNVGYIKKQKSAGLNYTFAGETALIEALRPELVDKQVVCYVRDYVIISEEPYETSKGTTMQNIRIKANIVFIHAPSDTEVMVCALGEGADTSDKATNKAMTDAYKYALRQTFCIETGDDPDKERVERASRKKAEAERNPATPAPAGIEYPSWVCDVENRSHVKYIDIDTAKLSYMLNELAKAEVTDEHTAKMKAIKAILEARAGA